MGLENGKRCLLTVAACGVPPDDVRGLARTSAAIPNARCGTDQTNMRRTSDRCPPNEGGGGLQGVENDVWVLQPGNRAIAGGPVHSARASLDARAECTCLTARWPGYNSLTLCTFSGSRHRNTPTEPCIWALLWSQRKAPMTRSMDPLLVALRPCTTEGPGVIPRGLGARFPPPSPYGTFRNGFVPNPPPPLANGDLPVGAASGRREYSTMASCQNPPPPTCTRAGPRGPSPRAGTQQ